jgi:hypothetical protein
MVIFHSYVSLAEGNHQKNGDNWEKNGWVWLENQDQDAMSQGGFQVIKDI